MSRQPPILPAVRAESVRAFLIKLDELEAAFEDLPMMEEYRYRRMERNINELRSTATAQLSTLEKALL